MSYEHTPSLIPKTPSRLLNTLMQHFGTNYDSHVAVFMGINANNMPRYRHGSYPMSAEFLIRVCDVLNMSLAEVRELAGLPAGYQPPVLTIPEVKQILRKNRKSRSKKNKVVVDEL